MRDPNRMDSFLEQIRVEWVKAPDLRFGQLLCCFFSEAGDPFSWEEDEFIIKLKAYMDGHIFVNRNIGKDESWQQTLNMAKYDESGGEDINE